MGGQTGGSEWVELVAEARRGQERRGQRGRYVRRWRQQGGQEARVSGRAALPQPRAQPSLLLCLCAPRPWRAQQGSTLPGGLAAWSAGSSRYRVSQKPTTLVRPHAWQVPRRPRHAAPLPRCPALAAAAGGFPGVGREVGPAGRSQPRVWAGGPAGRRRQTRHPTAGRSPHLVEALAGAEVHPANLAALVRGGPAGAPPAEVGRRGGRLGLRLRGAVLGAARGRGRGALRLRHVKAHYLLHAPGGAAGGWGVCRGAGAVTLLGWRSGGLEGPH